MGEGHPQGHHEEEEEGKGEEELVSQEGEGEGEEEPVPQEVGAMEGGVEIQGGGEGEVVLPGHLRVEEVEEEKEGWSRCQVGVGEGEGEEVEQVQLQERVAELFPKLQPLTSAAPLGGGREHYKEM